MKNHNDNAVLLISVILCSVILMPVSAKSAHNSKLERAAISKQFAKKDAAIANLRKEIALKDKVILSLYEKIKKYETPPPPEPAAFNATVDAALRWKVLYYNGRLELARGAHQHSLEYGEKSQDASEQGPKHMSGRLLTKDMQNARYYADLERGQDTLMDTYLREALKSYRALVQDRNFNGCYKPSDLCLPENQDNVKYTGTGIEDLRFYVPR